MFGVGWSIRPEGSSTRGPLPKCQGCRGLINRDAKCIRHNYKKNPFHLYLTVDQYHCRVECLRKMISKSRRGHSEFVRNRSSARGRRRCEGARIINKLSCGRTSIDTKSSCGRTSIDSPRERQRCSHRQNFSKKSYSETGTHDFRLPPVTFFPTFGNLVT